MSRTTRTLAAARRRQPIVVDESTRVWLTIDNVDTFRLALVASWSDAEAIALDGFGDEAQNVERLMEATARTLDTTVDEVIDNVAGRLWGMEQRDDCVRCGADYSPVCPSCVIDAGCSIG